MQAESSSQRLATVLWDGRYLIALSLFVGILLAILATVSASKVYESNALLRVNFVNAQNPADAEVAKETLAKDYSTVIVSPGFLERKRSKLAGGDLSVSELQSRLSAEQVPTTGLVKLSAQGSSPANARTLAGQVARTFVETLSEDNASELASRRASIDKLIAQVNAKIARLQGGGSIDPAARQQLTDINAQRAALILQRSKLLRSELTIGGDASLIGPPSAASSPIKPRPVLNLLAGLLLGLLVGCGLAWAAERFGTGLHSASEAGAYLDVPVLASIPFRRKLVPGDPASAEGYQVLHTNLTFQARSCGRRVVTFASINRGDGKTSIIEGLTYASARSETNVLIVDGDMRTRALSERLGQKDAQGLTECLVGTTREPPVLSLSPGLSLLPAGSPSASLPRLFPGVAMKELIARFRDEYELVVIDSPSAADLADALILASYSDCIAMVVRIGVTKRADLDAARTRFRYSGTPIAGVVVLESRSVKPYAQSTPVTPRRFFATLR